MKSSTVRSIDRSRRSARLAVAAIAFSALGCATNFRGYPGPTRPVQDVGVIAVGMAGTSSQRRYVALLQVDGKDRQFEWSGGRVVHLLPGTHEVRVECKQRTSIAFEDLAVAADVYASIRDKEASISFPVKAGFIHRIHYDAKKRRFAVSWESSSNRGVGTEDLYPKEKAIRHIPLTTQTPLGGTGRMEVDRFVDSLKPSADSVPCEAVVDESREHWCMARP